MNEKVTSVENFYKNQRSRAHDKKIFKMDI